jgi:hypothetical protein
MQGLSDLSGQPLFLRISGGEITLFFYLRSLLLSVAYFVS